MTTAMNLRVSLPPIRGEGEGRFDPILMALECLTQINMWHFKRGVVTPLFDAGIRYKAEPPGEENWNDALICMGSGYGDCEDLAAYYCAERRVLYGEKARCVIKQKFFSPEEVKSTGYPVVPKNGIFLIHCMVELPNGQTIDPSKLLGMSGEYQ